MADSFSFDPRMLRYRNITTGRLVGLEKIKDLSRTLIKDRTREGLVLTDRMLAGDLSVGDWETAIAKSLKNLHLQQYKLSAWKMESRDYGIVGNKLRNEYRFLRNFSLEIAAGKLSESRIRQRLAQYYNATWGTFERGRRESNRSAGARWEKRLLNSRIPCLQCPGYASVGWVPRGYLPDIGRDCDCGSNCKCTFVFAFGASPPDGQSLLSQNFGWINHGYS
jgi:hypothetical protein